MLRGFLFRNRRCQRQLNFTQTRHIVFNQDRVVILQIQRDVRTQARALGEQHQMLQIEVALNNLRARLRLCEATRTNTEHRLLFGVVALTAEHQLRTRRLNLHNLAESMHVAHDLLEVRGGHCQNTGELDRWNVDGIHIQLNQIQMETGHHLLVTILNLDAQLCRVRLLHVEHNALVVAHGLHELEEVDHVDAEHMALGTVELIEAIGAQTQMDQNGVGAIHGHNLQPGAVNLEIRIRQNVFDRLGECAERGGLHCADTEQQVGSIHSIGGFRSGSFSLPRLAWQAGVIGASATVCCSAFFLGGPGSPASETVARMVSRAGTLAAGARPFTLILN
jgi:hypothetical protein